MIMSANEVRGFIADLVRKYNYHRLPPGVSSKARAYYRDNLPDWVGDKQALETGRGVLLCTSFERVVVGDYGAFIEIRSDLINADQVCMQKGQEFRRDDPKYRDNVKYLWLTLRSDGSLKLYQQQRPVSYADYRLGSYYVSVFDVKPVEDS
jgi:hypothetical protein